MTGTGPLPEPAPRRDVLAGALVVCAAMVAFAAILWPSFHPKAGVGGDLTQDWLSAREHLAGFSAYGDLRDASLRHFGGEPAGGLRVNAHPPASVLLFLPLAYLSHEDAFFVWNLLSLVLFTAAVWLAAAQLGLRGLRAAGVTTLLIVACTTNFPMRQQVSWGQFSAPLAFLVTAAWVADRTGRWYLAGVAVGIAAAVKLFPAFLPLYFAAAGRWRTVAVVVVTAAAINAVALALFGIEAFRVYFGEVVPLTAARYGGAWTNLSVSAFWLRLFDPALSSGVTPLADAPLVGRALAAAARLAIVVAVGLAAWRARTPGRLDRAFAAAVVGMVLVSPLSWSHSLVLLVVPVGVLLRDARGPARWVLFACLAVLWLPDTFVTGLLFGRELADSLVGPNPRPLTPVETLLGIAVPHYALLGLFLLALMHAVEPVEPPGAG